MKAETNPVYRYWIKSFHSFVVNFAYIFAFVVCSFSYGYAETLITSLSSHRVAITSNYTGASVVVFGAIEKDAQTVPRSGGYDIVVTIRGPRQALAVREKSKIGLFWINRESQKFPESPAYLAVLSSRPIQEIAPDVVQKRQKIGLSAIIQHPTFTNTRDGQDIPFRDALLRLKAKDDLFVEIERGVTFLNPTIFRAAAPLPATSPPGGYDIEIVLLADGVVLSRQFSYFELVKTGFEQRMGILSHESPLLYALLVAGIAIFCGFFANFIFRRD